MLCRTSNNDAENLTLFFTVYLFVTNAANTCV